MRTHALKLAFATSAIALALAACSADATLSAEAAAPGNTEAAAPGNTEAAAPGNTAAAEPASDSRPTDDDMSLHPCLLSGAEVASVLGGDYDDGVLNTDFSGFPNYICDYTNTDTGVASIAITVVVPGGFTAQDQRPGFESAYDDVVDVTLTGADYAFTAGGGAIVAAQVGEYGVFVASNESIEGDPDGNTVRLAEIAVGNA